MKLHNALPHFLDHLDDWESFPSQTDFQRYLNPISHHLAPMISDFRGYRGMDFYPLLMETWGASAEAWQAFRNRAKRLSPESEEKRVREQISKVEGFLTKPLQGEVVLFGALSLMDGYARFDRGTHKVYLGVDEDFESGNYLDILISHELTHVARESQPSVWEGWGLDPAMSHDEFVESYPTLEHLFNEGFACVVSQGTNAVQSAAEPWRYVYQTPETWSQLCKPEALSAVDRRIHELLKDPSRSYRELYDIGSYGVELPPFAHYAWAWAWVKTVCRDSCSPWVDRCSKPLLESALEFRLERFLTVA